MNRDQKGKDIVILGVKQRFLQYKLHILFHPEKLFFRVSLYKCFLLFFLCGGKAVWPRYGQWLGGIIVVCKAVCLAGNSVTSCINTDNLWLWTGAVFFVVAGSL